ncbi:MAG: hypothetical protein BMS9Abin06_0428 [Gammaproteobacteria bacterium]|nr:MAG: hypothetical protein BMS9Abin06_0428 [Gammaproteobacteria bacterium]
MGKHSNTDKAIRNIMNWAERPEWLEEQAAVYDAHLAPVCDRIDINQEDLVLELEEHGYGGMLFGVVFEDFISRRLPDDKNIIDDYLKRRGWRESVPGRRYLQQLRDSVLSLYEVVEVSPGHHCDLRDLLRDGETFRVHERMGTQNLVKWDRLAARVLNMNDKHIFSGGILPFRQEAAQTLLRVLTESRKQFKKELSHAAGKKTAAKMLSSENLDELFLQDAAPAFTSIWLSHTLERLHEPLPELVNRNGEALLFTETRFPFLEEQLVEIAQRLDAAPEWEHDNPDEHTWIWLPQPDASANKPQRGMAIDTLQDGQRPISGTLELKSGVLTLTTNSMQRAERGQAVLETLLHGLVGPALSKLQTPEQLMAENESHQQSDGDREPTDTIDPEIAAEVIHNMLDQHYRQCLDEPIPMLDDKTPRQCAKSKKGREQVIEWLKYLENNELRRAASQGQAPYDSSWMWDELKLGKHRNC